jgi:hypothetical protein
MTRMPRSAVMSAALALAAIAVLGVYLGMGRGIPGPGGFRGETYVVARSSGSGRTVMAEPPPPLPALDEGAIRKIAREEAEAALTRGRPAAAPRKAARADTDSDAASAAGGDNADTGDSAATPVHTPTPPPASTPPTTPPAGPPDL